MEKPRPYVYDNFERRTCHRDTEKLICVARLAEQF